MFDLEREVCVCNSLTLGEIVTTIKEKKLTTVEEVMDVCEAGDKCESCIEEGYENDGFSLAMALGQVKQNRL